MIQAHVLLSFHVKPCCSAFNSYSYLAFLADLNYNSFCQSEGYICIYWKILVLLITCSATFILNSALHLGRRKWASYAVSNVCIKILLWMMDKKKDSDLNIIQNQVSFFFFPKGKSVSSKCILMVTFFIKLVFQNNSNFWFKEKIRRLRLSLASIKYSNSCLEMRQSENAETGCFTLWDSFISIFF